ncbi:MAG TPA: nucleotide-binding domain containing protein, partial [Sphaerochaeta sp.]|nr:nucleotide-binding domain containing protein [Sphaerochaeta sp.]
KALDALYASDLVLVLPALPDLGRVTLRGRQYLNGLPILETEHAHDPTKAVTEDNLVSLLSRVYDEPIGFVPLEKIRSGSFDISQARIVVCDSETNEDMLIVLKTVVALQKKVLYVGTAALAEHLCELENPAKPSLGIIASLNSVSADQVRYAQKSGVASVLLPIADLLAGKDTLETYIERAVVILSEGKDLLVVSSGVVDPASYEASLNRGELQGLSKEEVSRQTRLLISEVGKALVDRVPLSGVVITGGDTAMGLMESLGVRMAEIVTEVAFGIPLTRLVGFPHDGMKVITKAGGFGKSDAILFALRFLKAHI